MNISAVKVYALRQTYNQGILSKTEAKEKRNLLFEEEKKRQRTAVGKIKKIEVKYQSRVEEITLIMNKCISTLTSHKIR